MCVCVCVDEVMVRMETGEKEVVQGCQKKVDRDKRLIKYRVLLWESPP